MCECPLVNRRGRTCPRVNDGVLGDDGGDGWNWVGKFGLEARRRRPAGGETAGGEIFGAFLKRLVEVFGGV